MRVPLLVLAALLLLATPAAAENPVLDAEGDADVVSALAEAREVQGVCYGYSLFVSDNDTGQFSGTYDVSNAGVGTTPTDCPQGSVVLLADITYTSSLSESEDSASWRLDSSLPGLSIGDVEALGLSAGDLLDDGTSETTLLNAVLSLPGLATEEAGVPPLVLDPNTEPLPEDARATGTPGSDWLRENTALLVLCALLVGGGVLLFVLSLDRVRTGMGDAARRSVGEPPRSSPPPAGPVPAGPPPPSNRPPPHSPPTNPWSPA